jgi:5'-nucleotidase
MKILLTNDDGITAPGLNDFLRGLSGEGYEVMVAAPARECSGVSHAITVRQPIFVEKYEFADVSVRGWSIDGCPADCVKIALEILLKDDSPDLVVSGINKGSNLGIDTIYSGTVGAALEASMHGVPAMAFSLDSGEDRPDYAVAVEFAVKMVKMQKTMFLPKTTMLNVNIPGVARTEIKGARTVRIGEIAYKNPFSPRQDLKGRTYYWLGGELIKNLSDDLSTDAASLDQNWITVTPLRYDWTDYETLAKLPEIIF